MADLCGYAMSVAPDRAVAGRRGTWTVEFTIGQDGMRVGGAIRLRPPEKGMVRWWVGKVTACTSRPGAGCEVQLFDCHPISYHWRHTPIIQVNLFGEALRPGDTVTVTIGDRGGYSRGYLQGARAQLHAQQDARWDAWIDIEGNRSLQPERAIDQPWEPLEPVYMHVASDCPARLSVTGAQPGPDDEDVLLLIVARDRYGNHCPEHEGELQVVCDRGIARQEMKEGRTLGAVPRGRSNGSRVYVVDLAAEIVGVSNPVCRGFAEGLVPYFGDLHVMTGEGVIASALEDTRYGYEWAQGVAGLDFCSITNKPNESWQVDLALDDEYHVTGEFVTIPACEMSFPGGHKNAYFPTTDAPAPDASSTDALFASLEGRDALVIPHHTSVYSESSRETFWSEHDFDTHDPRFERLIEMSQNRGSMECEQVGGNVYFGGTGSSVWSALQRGMKVGFVGGTDNHRAQPSETNASVGGLDPEEVTVGGLTCALASELTRQGIWEALWSRRCYATQGQRTLLWFELAGEPMGSIIEGEKAAQLADKRTFRARVVGHRPLVKIELVRNDGLVRDLGAEGIIDLSDELNAGEWEDVDALSSLPRAGDAVFYYLRVTEADGRMAWSSPVWIVG